MDPITAKKVLTPQALRDTTIVLAALDCLQAHAWHDKYETKVKSLCPHGESNVITMSNDALKRFTIASLPGNANGVNMMVSAFVNGLQVLEMSHEVAIVLDACTQYPITHKIMNPIKLETLGGLPSERFVGRWIKAKIPDQGMCRVKCIDALWGKMVVEIKVKDSKRQYHVPLMDCTPNWPDNDDLRREREHILASPEALADLKSELDSRMAPVFAKPETPKFVKPVKPPEPVEPPVEPEPEPEPIVSVQPSVSKPNPAPAGSTRLEIDPVFDPTWVGDYQVMNSTLVEQEEIKRKREELTIQERDASELIAFCLSEMLRKGVRLVGVDGVTVSPVLGAPAPAAMNGHQDSRPSHPALVNMGRQHATKDEMERRKKAILEAIKAMTPGDSVDMRGMCARAGIIYNSGNHKHVLAAIRSFPNISIGTGSGTKSLKLLFTRNK